MIVSAIVLALAPQAASADNIACAYAGLPPLTRPRAYGAYSGAATPTRAIANVKALVEPLARMAAERCGAERGWTAVQVNSAMDYATAYMLVGISIERGITGNLTISTANQLFDSLPSGIEAILQSLPTATRKDRERAMEAFAKALRARVPEESQQLTAVNFAEHVAAMRKAIRAFAGRQPG